jgi:uncharacterized protein (UPF0335 family)
MPQSKPEDLNEIFDLDRKKLTGKMVDNIEQCMRDVQTAQDDLKEVIASCREAHFSPNDIAAMKTIARLRMKDQGADAREKLAALERIAEAVGFNLFDWADQEAPPKAA